VQYQLLKLGIDSARLTTDSGIDLRMYVPGHQAAATIQVKANVAPKPAGSKGKLLLNWPFPDDSPAQLTAHTFHAPCNMASWTHGFRLVT
jgi:hypothetical protein